MPGYDPNRDQSFGGKRIAGMRGAVEPFTGNITLRPEHEGLIFRCDDANPVTVNVSADLPEGFNAAVMRWGAGTVTFAGATNRSSATQVSPQYGVGTVIIGKNANGSSAEFILKGDVA